MYFLAGVPFAFRKKITINNNSGGALTDYQVSMTVTYTAAMQAAFGDLRFAYPDGTNIPYWIESKTDSSTALVWIKVSLSNYGTSPTGDNFVFMYYGNISVASASSGVNTFVYFENFAGNPTGDWTWTDDYGSPPHSVNGYMSMNDPINNNRNSHYTHNSLNLGGLHVYRSKMNLKAADPNLGYITWVLRYASATNYYLFQMVNPAYVPTNNLRFYRYDSGTPTVLAQKTFEISFNHYYDVRVQFDGAGFKIYMDGNLELSGTPDDGKTYSGTMVMYEVRSSGLWDDVIIRKLTATEPTVTATGSEEHNRRGKIKFLN